MVWPTDRKLYYVALFVLLTLSEIIIGIGTFSEKAIVSSSIHYSAVGETANFFCSTEGVQVSHCLWEKSKNPTKPKWIVTLQFFSDKKHDTNSYEAVPGYFYYGEGLQNGQCGVSIKNVTTDDYSFWKCTLVSTNGNNTSIYVGYLTIVSKEEYIFTLYTILIAFSVLIVLLFVFCAIHLRKKPKASRVKIKVKLSQLEMKEFQNGVDLETLKSPEVNEEALTVPYATEYELNRDNVIIFKTKLLRDGYFGLTFKGRFISENRLVAVKLVDSNSYSITLKMLLTEIKILIHVGKHPHIDSIIGAFTTQIKNGIAYFISDLCENGSLENYLRTNSVSILSRSTKSSLYPKSLEQLMKWAYHIACGMEHITSKNVIHSDLATKNVLLDSNLNAKITDLGLSRHIFEYRNYVENNELPTPWRWMAPESLKHLTFSSKTDVWAYGVTLWEIFSVGMLPYFEIQSTNGFVQMLEEGHRLNKPEIAPSSVYYEMHMCWNVTSEERPTFTQLKTNLHEMNRDSVKVSNVSDGIRKQ